MSYFSNNHAALSSKRRLVLVGIRIMCPSGETCLPADCGFSISMHSNVSLIYMQWRCFNVKMTLCAMTLFQHRNDVVCREVVSTSKLRCVPWRCFNVEITLCIVTLFQLWNDVVCRYVFETLKWTFASWLCFNVEMTLCAVTLFNVEMTLGVMTLFNVEMTLSAVTLFQRWNDVECRFDCNLLPA